MRPCKITSTLTAELTSMELEVDVHADRTSVFMDEGSKNLGGEGGGTLCAALLPAFALSFSRPNSLERCTGILLRAGSSSLFRLFRLSLRRSSCRCRHERGRGREREPSGAQPAVEDELLPGVPAALVR